MPTNNMGSAVGGIGMGPKEKGPIPYQYAHQLYRYETGYRRRLATMTKLDIGGQYSQLKTSSRLANLGTTRCLGWPSM